MRPVQAVPADRPVWLSAFPGAIWAHTHQLILVCLTFSAWLVLLQMGMTLTWNWFSGLLPLALWWVWMVLDPFGAKGRRPAMTVWSAAGVVVGVLVVHWAGRTAVGGVGLVLTALAWAQWLLCVRQQGPDLAEQWSLSGVCMRLVVQLMGLWVAVWLAADPMLWMQRWPALFLVWLAWFLCGFMCQRTRAQSLSANDHHRIFDAASPMLHPAMAMMMGGLLLMAQWCVTVGWTYTQAVLLHGVVMVAVPFAMNVWEQVGRKSAGRYVSGRFRPWTGFAPWLGVVGAWMFWQLGSPPSMLLAMALIAWAIHAGSTLYSTRLHALVAMCLFLPGLLWMGHFSPIQGPQAIATPLLGVTVLWALVSGLQHRYQWRSS